MFVGMAVVGTAAVGTVAASLLLGPAPLCVIDIRARSERSVVMNTFATFDIIFHERVECALRAIKILAAVSCSICAF